MLAPPPPERSCFGPLFQEIAELTSESTASRLILWFGGQRIVFPQNPKPSHRLSMVTGQSHFEILCRYFGGVQIDVPKGAIAQRRRTMQIMRGLVRVAGWSEVAVADRFGISRQYVNLLCQPDKAWIGTASVKELQTFTPTFQLGLNLGFEQDNGEQGGESSMLGDAFKVIRAIVKVKQMIADAEADGVTTREELLEIAAYGLSVILEFEGVGTWVAKTLGRPETDKGAIAQKTVVEALQESKGDG